MGTTYILKSVSREDLKKATTRKTWAGGRHTWENLQYVVPTSSVYAYSDEQSAMVDARMSNRNRNSAIVHFVQELDAYEE